MGPEELTLNAEMAPEDPRDLQGMRERKGRPFLGSSTGTVQPLTPGEAGWGNLDPWRPSSSFLLGWGDPRNTTLDLMPG